MGFLDHSTNNIILDAVLTDTGRQFLSRNDGSFSLIKFALGDDEVNYNIITKYGRVVGREKIEKNTPVFEALTNQSHAQKYKLVSISNPNLIRLPSFSFISDASINENTVLLYTSSNQGKKTSATLTFEQTILNEAVIDVELRDSMFILDVPNLFLDVNSGNSSPNNVDNMQRANYILPASTNSNSSGGSIVQFTIGVKSLSQTLFDVYGTGSSKNVIKNYIRLTGMQSGTVKDIAVNIQQTTA
jgi:hypothetical protein